MHVKKKYVNMVANRVISFSYVHIKARIGCHDEGVVTCVALTP
jgi:hypothetical protein